MKLDSPQLQYTYSRNKGFKFEIIEDTRMMWEVERDKLIEKNCTCEPCNYCADNNPAKWKK